jgi:hypothetical protein
MNVSVINLDGTTTDYGYAPEHKESVLEFYNKLYWAKEISGFSIAHDNGEQIKFGWLKNNG